MPDQNVEIGIRTTADASGAKAQAEALERVAGSTQKLTDETERYQKALEEMAAAQAAANEKLASADDQAMVANSNALKDLIRQANERKAEAEKAVAAQRSESDRYQAALQQMAERQQSQGQSAGGAKNKENQDWLLAMAERRTVIKNASDDTKAAAEIGKKAEEELTEKTKFLTLKKGDLKKVIKEIGHEFPIVGMAGRLFANPIVAAATAAITTFGLVKAKLAEMNQEMDEAAARNASRDFLPGIEAKSAALKDATTAASQFQASLNNIGKAEDQVQSAIQRAIDKLHEFVNAQAEINNAAEARDLAQVDAAQKAGKMTDVQAITARATIREKYRKAADDLKTQTEQQEIKMAETELAREKEVLPSTEATEAAVRRRRDAIKARLAQAKKDLEAGQGADGKGGKLGEYQAEYDKAFAQFEKAQSDYERSGSYTGTFGTVDTRAPAKATLESAQSKMEQAKAMLDLQRRNNALNQKKIEELESGKLPQAEADLSSADELLRTRKQRIYQLQNEIPTKREIYGIREQGRDIAGGIRGETANIEVSAQLGQKLQENQQQQAQLQKQMAEAVISGRGVNQESTELLRRLAEDNERIWTVLKQYNERLKRQAVGGGL